MTVEIIPRSFYAIQSFPWEDELLQFVTSGKMQLVLNIAHQ